MMYTSKGEVVMKILAATMPATGQPFQIEEVDLEEPRSDEILVRIVGFLN